MNREAYFKVLGTHKADIIRPHTFAVSRLRCHAPELAFGITTTINDMRQLYSVVYPWFYEMPIPHKTITKGHQHFSTIAEKGTPYNEYDGRNII